MTVVLPPMSFINLSISKYRCALILIAMDVLQLFSPINNFDHLCLVYHCADYTPRRIGIFCISNGVCFGKKVIAMYISSFISIVLYGL